MTIQSPPATRSYVPLYGPRPPTPLERRWPGPSRPADAVALGATGMAGLVAAASVPLDRPGVGWAVAGVAGAAALTVLSMRGWADGGPVGRGPAVRPAPVAGTIRPLWTIATLALLSVGTVRAAGWLFVLCLLTAAVTASLAVTAGRSLPALAVTSVAVPVAALRSMPWVTRGAKLLAHRQRGGPSVRITATVGVSLLLLLVFGGLFASADAAFAELVGRVTPELSAPTVARWVYLFVITTMALLGGAYLLAAPPRLDGLERPAKARLRRLEWTLPLVALNAVFLAFVAVQLTVLFGGAGHVLRTAGLTYAEYARRGFWQLLVVTALTLGILALAARWAPRDNPRDRLLVRALLGGLAALCLVIVASALLRMHTYEEAYGFTRLRVLVSACELWLGSVLVMVLAAGVRLRAGWLPQAAIGSGVAALIGLAMLNPDHFIADRNITRYEDTGKIDVAYLSGLSADAVPALDRLPATLRSCALGDVARDLAERHDWRGWNIGVDRARHALGDESATSFRWSEACGPARIYW
jgi:FtsH-binding integral membrane protein